MTPQFSLTLSSDGICLLHRVPDGWNLVGKVPLDTLDLTQALADLRRDGLRLEPGGMQTKLVIPEDQIKFMSLDGAQTSIADVRAALDGATPYAIDDLAIDFDRSGGQTHIAAVARETLAEAEAFATEHEFNPVCFVAVPMPGTFGAEVFFGPTQSADATDVGRESDPVRQTGVTDLSDPMPDPVSDTPNDMTDQPDDTDETDDGPVFTSRIRSGATTGPMAAGAMPGGAAPDSVDSATPQGKDESSGLGLPGGTDVAEPVAKPPVTASRATPVSGAPQELLFTRRKEPPPPVPGKAATASPVARRADAGSALSATPAMAGVVADPRPGAAQPVRRTPPPPFDPHRAAAAPADETLPPMPSSRPRKPRFLGLILTAILLIVLLIAGFWASTLPDNGISWLWGGDAVQTADTQTDADADAPVPADAVVASAPAALQPDPPADVPAPSALDPAPAEQTLAAPELPIVRAPTAGVLTPAEADRIYAATGVYQRAPRIPVTPRTTLDEGPRPESTALEPMTGIDTPGLPEFSTTAPDAVIAAPVNPPSADIVFARDVWGRILATPDGTLLPSGAVIFAGAPDVRPALRPGSASPVAAPVAQQRADPNAPETVRLIAGRPPVVPRARPEGAAPAAPQTDASLANPDEATGTADTRPALRPDAVVPNDTSTAPGNGISIDTPTDIAAGTTPRPSSFRAHRTADRRCVQQALPSVLRSWRHRR